MKIRTKMLLCFMACALAVASASLIITNRFSYGEVLNDHVNEFRLMLHQTLNSIDLIAEDIEAALLSLHTGVALAHTSQQRQDVAASMRQRNLTSKLRYMCYNSAYFTAMVFMDEQGEMFHGSSDLSESSEPMFALVLDQYDNLAGSYTRWFGDEAGNVYLKKDIYAVSPLYRCGILIARVNAEYLRAYLGMDILAERTGVSVILSAGGDPVLINGAFSHEEARQIQDAYLSGQTSYSGVIDGSDGLYHLQSDSLPHAWRMFHLIPLRDMQALPRRLARINALVFALVFAASVPLLLLTAHSLTRGVDRLYKAMSAVSQGNFDVRLQSCSRDEIGMLTRHFSWLLGELKTRTAQMICRATEKQQAEYEMLEVKYRSLQSQISPHFICNILTTISAVSQLGRPEQVSDLTILVSRYLRSNLSNMDKKRVALACEIQYVEDYLSIYRTVYGNRVRLTKEIPRAALPLAVPNMLLQPLVENALQHGDLEGGEICELILRAELEDASLKILLSDNGKGIAPELLAELNQATIDPTFDKRLKGFGLKVIIQRLRLLYPDSSPLKIESTAAGTRITITLPPCAADDKQQNDRATPPQAWGLA